LNNEKELALQMIKDKGISISQDLINTKYSRYSFIFCENYDKIVNEIRYLEICNYFNSRSKKILISNPIKTIKFIIKRSLSFSLLNPFHVYADNLYISEKYYYKSDLHQNLIKYRAIYSLIIYLICFIGFIYLLKLKKNDLVFFVILSSLYFFIILSWHGNNRYFTPILIYQSIFFANGLRFILDFFKKQIAQRENIS
jgi:asparagine N-glycosylation enzyme membrane subunit Stt3